MSDIEKLTKQILEFIEEREWHPFHDPKDLALSLTLEAAEVLEKFQWKKEDEIKEYVEKNKDEIGEELSDVLYWVLLMNHYLKLDVVDAFEKKMEKNRKKYPIEKAKGKSTKYTGL